MVLPYQYYVWLWNILLVMVQYSYSYSILNFTLSMKTKILVKSAWNEFVLVLTTSIITSFLTYFLLLLIIILGIAFWNFAAKRYYKSNICSVHRHVLCVYITELLYIHSKRHTPLRFTTFRSPYKNTQTIHKKICNFNLNICLLALFGSEFSKDKRGINLFLYVTLFIMEILALQSAKNFIRMVKNIRTLIRFLGIYLKRKSWLVSVFALTSN